MNSDNPVCICGHLFSEHYAALDNPRCRHMIYPEPGEEWRPWPCDCPGFETDPKASE